MRVGTLHEDCTAYLQGRERTFTVTLEFLLLWKNPVLILTELKKKVKIQKHPSEEMAVKINLKGLLRGR